MWYGLFLNDADGVRRLAHVAFFPSSYVPLQGVIGIADFPLAEHLLTALCAEYGRTAVDDIQARRLVIIDEKTGQRF